MSGANRNLKDSLVGLEKLNLKGQFVRSEFFGCPSLIGQDLGRSRRSKQYEPEEPVTKHRGERDEIRTCQSTKEAS